MMPAQSRQGFNNILFGLKWIKRKQRAKPYGPGMSIYFNRQIIEFRLGAVKLLYTRNIILW